METFTLNNNSCPPKSDLQQLLNGHLSQWTSLQLRQHVESCADCQRLLALMRQDTVPSGPDSLPEIIVSENPAKDTGSMSPIDIEKQFFAGTSNPEMATTAYRISEDGVPLEIQSHGKTKISLSFLSPAQAADEIGRLGSYIVRRVLGTGGMGIVFDAEDGLLRRQVALKVMKPDLAANPTHKQRFLEEARSGASIPHDNIVTVYQVGIENGMPFLAMQFLQGESLGAKLEREKKIPYSEALKIIKEVANGLVVAHESELIHRDIKPDNIWLETDQPGNPWKKIKILDFGLATTITETSNNANNGLIMGTPSYMAPEQARGLAVDGRSDLFSLGCVLYQMLTGVLPFKGETTLNILNSLALDEPTPVNMLDPLIPDGVSRLVKDLLKKKPSERVGNASILVERIDAIEQGISNPNITNLQQVVTSPEHLPATSFGALPAPIPWYKNWKIGIIAAVMLINLGLLLFNFSNFGLIPSNLGGLTQGTPVKVGILHSSNGHMRNAGKGAKNAILLAIEELNLSGGIMEYSEKGSPVQRRIVEPVIEDPLSDSSKYAELAKKLIEEDKVSVIFGCWTSVERKNCLDVLKANDHLLMYAVSHEGLEQHPNVVYVGATPNQQVEFAISNLTQKAGKKKIYLVGEDSVYSQSVREIIHQHLKGLKEENPSQTFEIVGEKFIFPPPYSAKFDTLAQEIIDAKPDLIVNTITGDAIRDFFKELRAKGIKASDIPTISFHITGELLQEIDITSSIGDYVGWNYLPSLQAELNNKFIESFKKKYGSDTIISDDMESSYASVHLWAQGARLARSFQPQKVRENFKGAFFNAPSGKLEIDQETQGVFRISRFGKITGPGKFEVIETPESKPTRPIQFPRYRSEDSWKKFSEELFTKWNNNWSGSPSN